MNTSQCYNLLIILIAVIGSYAHHSDGAVLWRGDFETEDFSQWDYLLHPAGFSITRDCVREGKAAARITINGKESFLWQGRKELNRSELQYKPTQGATIEGKDTFFRFSFYLKSPFSEREHALGYWESHGNFQQMMRFNITGTALSFQETATNNPFWRLPNGAAPRRWHQLLMHIHWSTDAHKGFVQTWVDGTDMGKNNFKTLNSPNAAMFTQIGILRHQEDSIEEIFIDDVMATDSLAELQQHTLQPSTQQCTL